MTNLTTSLDISAVNPTGSQGNTWLQDTDRRALTDKEEHQLDAIFGRILPEDTGRAVPGAVQAGASRFVSLLLARDAAVCEDIPDWLASYQEWLPALDGYCLQEYGKPLISAGDAALDAMLKALEAGTLVGPSADIDQKKAFKTLYRHCIQGCFADPRWGGNRDRMMWQWLGYLPLPKGPQ